MRPSQFYQKPARNVKETARDPGAGSGKRGKTCRHFLVLQLLTILWRTKDQHRVHGRREGQKQLL